MHERMKLHASLASACILVSIVDVYLLWKKKANPLHDISLRRCLPALFALGPGVRMKMMGMFSRNSTNYRS